ncbi:MAG: SPFH domain-containing protein [Oscillospiraceae bacterium]
MKTSPVRSETVKKILRPALIVLAVLIVLLNSITIVQAGHTGVVVTLGKVKEGVLAEGIHFKAPFVQKVVKIDNRIQKLEVQTEAFSKDLQSVQTVLAINYRVDTAKSYSIYKNIGATETVPCAGCQRGAKHTPSTPPRERHEPCAHLRGAGRAAQCQAQRRWAVRHGREHHRF